MQILGLKLACVLMALWGAGSVVPALGHLTGGWLAFAPRAAAALLFTGMFFGPTRSSEGREEQSSEDP